MFVISLIVVLLVVYNAYVAYCLFVILPKHGVLYCKIPFVNKIWEITEIWEIAKQSQDVE